MAKKKRAWNMSNPLYRYLHAKKSGVVRKTKKIKRSVSRMARRRSVSHVRRSGGLGLQGKLMNGLLPTSGLIGNALKGIGAATLADSVPVQFAFKHEAAAFLTGGVAGAGAVIIAKALTNSQNLQGGTNALFVA